MWYRHARKTYAQATAADLERETLDSIGGVSSHDDVEAKPLEAGQPPIKPPPPNVDTFEVEEPDSEPDSDGQSDDSFTDYTPDSTSEEQQIQDEQDLSRAQDLSTVMNKIGLQWPLHDKCRCRIQFRPDDSSAELLVPRWEVSSGPCPHCLDAQKAFNAYVEGAGIRVSKPNASAWS